MNQLAQRLMEAVSIHEHSYDPVARWYKTRLGDAVLKAAGDHGRHTHESKLILLLLEACWNDAQDWAKETLEAT